MRSPVSGKGVCRVQLASLQKSALVDDARHRVEGLAIDGLD
jgi:hypothetical protein